MVSQKISLPLPQKVFGLNSLRPLEIPGYQLVCTFLLKFCLLKPPYSFCHGRWSGYEYWVVWPCDLSINVFCSIVKVNDCAILKSLILIYKLIHVNIQKVRLIIQKDS